MKKTISIILFLMVAFSNVFSQDERYIPKIKTDQIKIANTTVQEFVPDSSTDNHMLYKNASGVIKDLTVTSPLTFSNGTLAGYTEAQTRLSADTVVLYSTSLGRNIITDTAYFRPTYEYPALYVDGTDTLYVTKIIGVVQGSSPSVALKMVFDVNHLDGTPTEINSSALTITSTTAGTSTTTIANPKVPPGVWMWPDVTAVATQPYMLTLNVFGYRIKKR